MRNVIAIFRRELSGYFSTPVAYVFISIFLFLTGLFTFQLGNFYEARQADLLAIFTWLPWLYLFLVPAVSMRLWAEERQSGTIELLLTLPVSIAQAVVGKFLAAWLFLTIALGLTFPIVLTALYLGEPDMGVVFASYIGAALMAGSYLAIGSCVSALNKNQVISFVLSVVICFLFMLAGFSVVLDWFVKWAPQWLVDAISATSFNTHFVSVARGVIDLGDIIFFASIMVAWLYACAVLLEYKKAD